MPVSHPSSSLHSPSPSSLLDRPMTSTRIHAAAVHPPHSMHRGGLAEESGAGWSLVGHCDSRHGSSKGRRLMQHSPRTQHKAFVWVHGETAATRVQSPGWAQREPASGKNASVVCRYSHKPGAVRRHAGYGGINKPQCVSHTGEYAQ